MPVETIIDPVTGAPIEVDIPYRPARPGAARSSGAAARRPARPGQQPTGLPPGFEEAEAAARTRLSSGPGRGNVQSGGGSPHAPPEDPQYGDPRAGGGPGFGTGYSGFDGGPPGIQEASQNAGLKKSAADQAALDNALIQSQIDATLTPEDRKLLQDDAQAFTYGQNAIGRRFDATQARYGREHQTGERIGAQEFNAEQARIMREYGVSEREATQIYNAEQAEKARTFTGQQNEAQRLFTGEQNEAQRLFTGEQNEADRSLSNEQFGKRFGLDEKRFGLDEFLGKGQLELGGKRLALDDRLGTGQLQLGENRLALDDRLGTGRLNLDSELGRGRLNLDRELGRGQLQLGQNRLGLDRELGTGRLNLDTELGRGQLQLGQDRLGEDRRQFDDRLGFDRTRLDRELGESGRQFDQRLGLDRDRFGLDSELGRGQLQLGRDQFEGGLALDRDRFNAELLSSGRNFLAAAYAQRGESIPAPDIGQPGAQAQGSPGGGGGLPQAVQQAAGGGGQGGLNVAALAPPGVRNVLQGQSVGGLGRRGGARAADPNTLSSLTQDERGALDTALRRTQGGTLGEFEQESQQRFGPARQAGRRARQLRVGV